MAGFIARVFNPGMEAIIHVEAPVGAAEFIARGFNPGMEGIIHVEAPVGAAEFIPGMGRSCMIKIP